MINRRQFNKGLVGIAFGGLFTHLKASALLLEGNSEGALPIDKAYGPLVSDPNGLLDLPEGFQYRVLSKLGDVMSDGLPVPDRADGMGCIPLDEERVVLVRNHEISLPKGNEHKQLPPENLSSSAYDSHASGRPLAGGTSSIVYNVKTQEVDNQFMSLLGTVRNCAGGTTPWSSWLTCEESVDKASSIISEDHGYVFEVPASASGLVAPVPLKAMGRFNHEAACVDPRTGIVYLTEDRGDSLFYRFIPNVQGQLDKGGKLQALAVIDAPKFDTRNWSSVAMESDKAYGCYWIDLDNVTSPEDDLRARGYSDGAALFARGEGIQFDGDEMYFCCTSGGNKKLGQIMRYVPSPMEGKAGEQDQPGELSLFLESPDKATFNFGDNLTIGQNGHLIVCEDQYSDLVDNHLKGVTPEGKTYDLGKVRLQTEPAGACFSPDGKTLFVNLYSPTVTLAITGPWDDFVA